MECPRISLFTGSPVKPVSVKTCPLDPSSPIFDSPMAPTAFVFDQKPVIKPISASNPHSSTETAS